MDLKQYEMELYSKYKAGDNEAKKELIKSFEPLINSQVAKFQNSGLPVIALKNEARDLFKQAIDTYDPTKGAQLNTHAVNYLKKLSRFTTNYQNVGHIPEPRALKIGQYQTIYSNIETEKGREPTAIEIADAMSLPLAEIDRLQTELRKDLSTTIIQDDDDAGGFYQYAAPMSYDPKVKEAIEFVYFDADSTDRKILEMMLGLHGVQRRKAKDISVALRITEADLKLRREKLAMQIKELT